MSVYRELLAARGLATPGSSGIYDPLHLQAYRDLSAGGGATGTVTGTPTKGVDLLRSAAGGFPNTGGGRLARPQLIGARLSGTAAIDYGAGPSMASGQAFSMGCWYRRVTSGSGALGFFGKATSGANVGGIFYVDGSNNLVHHMVNGGSADGYAIPETPPGGSSRWAIGDVGRLVHAVVTVGTDNALRWYIDGVGPWPFEYQIGPAYTVEHVTSRVLTNRNNSGNCRVGAIPGFTATDVMVHGAFFLQRQLSGSEVLGLYLAGRHDARRALGAQPVAA